MSFSGVDIVRLELRGQFILLCYIILYYTIIIYYYIISLYHVTFLWWWWCTFLLIDDVPKIRAKEWAWVGEGWRHYLIYWTEDPKDTDKNGLKWVEKAGEGSSVLRGGTGRHGSPLCTTTSKLQLKYRTTITQNHQKSRLILSLTTTELKKPHPTRLVGGAHMQSRLVFHPHVVDKNSGGISWEQGVPAPHQGHSPSFQFQEDKSPQLLAAKTRGEEIELVEEISGAPDSSS